LTGIFTINNHTMKASRRKTNKTPASAPLIQSPKLPPSQEQIRQRAHEIYVARGGGEGMALQDWLAAEQELMENHTG